MAQSPAFNRIHDFYLILASFYGYGPKLIEMAEMKHTSRLRGTAMLFAAAAIGLITELALPAWAYGAGPHVHGRAALEIAIDEATVQVNLNSPLDNLLGFEHAPRNEKERHAARVMATKLRQADTLFIFTPAAKCRLASVQMESPLLAPELLMPGSGPGNGNGSGAPNKADNPKGDKLKGDKSAVPSRAPSIPTVSSGTTLSQPALSDEHADDHAELEATWNLRCALPQALQGVDVRLFQVFPGLRRLDVAIAGPKGQSSAKLSPASTRLKW